MNVTKDQVVETMSFIWVTFRSKNDSQTAESPKPTLVWVISQKSWEARAHSAAYRQLKKLRVFFPRDRPNPPQSNLTGFCLSQSDGPVAESSLQLGLFIFWKKGSHFVQFQRLLEAVFGCLPSDLRTIPSVWVFLRGRNLAQQNRRGP